MRSEVSASEKILYHVLMIFIGGFEFMLAVGIIHHEWLPQLPTIGYWWAVLIVGLLKGTFSHSKPLEGTR